MVDAILWDNDGVLVDTEEMFFAATRDALARAGVTLTRAFYLECMLVNGRNVFDLVEQRGWTPQQVRALRAKRDADYAERLGSGARVMDSVAQTLQLLHALIGHCRAGVPDHMKGQQQPILIIVEVRIDVLRHASRLRCSAISGLAPPRRAW